MSTMAQQSRLEVCNMFTLSDKQGRIMLPKELCDFAGIAYTKGTILHVVRMNDSGTEFEIIPERAADGNTCIYGILRPDEKGRIFLTKVLKGLQPETRFKISARKGRLHFKIVS